MTKRCKVATAMVTGGSFAGHLLSSGDGVGL